MKHEYLQVASNPNAHAEAILVVIHSINGNRMLFISGCAVVHRYIVCYRIIASLYNA
jgi:hypothetical protein